MHTDSSSAISYAELTNSEWDKTAAVHLLRDLILFIIWAQVHTWRNSAKQTKYFKGTRSAMGPRWPGHYFCLFEKRLPQPEIKCTRRIHSNPIQSCLVFHPILDLLQKASFWANVNSSYDIILSYLVKNSIQRNMNRRGEKRVGAGREKLPSFTKITKEMNQ